MLEFIKRKSAVGEQHVMTAQTTGSNKSVVSAVDISRFDKIINWCLYALIVIVPILFLPITSELRDFNKQNFIFFLMVVMIGVWIIKILSTRRTTWVKTSLDLIFLIYLVIYFLACLISIDRVSSFLGYYGRFTGSFISVFSLVILYFIVVNNVRSQKVFEKIINCYLIGSGLALVYSLLQLLGIYIIPVAATHTRGFNPIGGLVSLAIYAALSLAFFQWVFFAQLANSRLKNIMLWLLSLLALAILFLINAFVAWIVLAISLIGLLALAMGAGAESSQGVSSRPWHWKPMLFLIVSVLFIAFQFLPPALNPRNMISFNLPTEIQLSNSTTWSLVSNSLKGSLKTAVLGSGPGTTGIVFGDIKPESLNKTIVWNLNFDRASSEIANIIIETGVVGFLAFELAAVLFFFFALFFLLKQSSHLGWKFALGAFILWLAMYITHFFYFFNTTFYFIYWLSVGLFMAAAHMKTAPEEPNSFSLAQSPRSALSWMFVSLLILAMLLVGTFFEAAVYGGEGSYAAGQKELNQSKPDYAKVSVDFTRAITLNPYRDVYLLGYGQNLFFQASQEAAKPNPDIKQIQTWMRNLIAAGKKSTEISSAKASNWSALAQFYTNIRGLVSGTDAHIIDSWQKAIERDPKNPALYVRLGLAYSIASDIIDPSIAGTGADADQDGLADTVEQQLGSAPNNSDTNANGVSDGDEVKAGFNPVTGLNLAGQHLSQFARTDGAMLKKAEDALNKAIELKPNLPDSYIALARVQEKSGQLAEAKKQLDAAAKQFPNNADILFEQGRITFNQRDYTAAEKIFKTVISLAPNHANAHYSLGLIYQQRGDIANALAEFEKAEEIAGPNVELEKLINQLKTP